MSWKSILQMLGWLKWYKYLFLHSVSVDASSYLCVCNFFLKDRWSHQYLCCKIFLFWVVLNWWSWKIFFDEFLKQKGSVTLVKVLLLSALETCCTEQLNIGLKKWLRFYGYCYPCSHVLNSVVQFGCSADSPNCSVYFFKLSWIVEDYFDYLL